MSKLSAEQIAAERERLQFEKCRIHGDFQRKVERGWLYKPGALEEYRAKIKKINEQIAALDA